MVEHRLCKPRVTGSIPVSGSKKPWVNPELRVYVRQGGLTGSNKKSNSGFDKKSYQREYMRRRRAEKGA